MNHLFSPLTLNQVTLRNRIGIAPMCQYSAGSDGLATDYHLAHLGARALGGAGLVILEATAVAAQGRISLADLGLWDDAQVAPLARIAGFLERHGAVAGIQIAHAGRKAGTAVPWRGGQPLSDADGGFVPAGPSAIAFGPAYRAPHALSLDELDGVRRQFRDAALRAKAAGFRFLELHAAHGYLLHSFVSPLSNRRTDAYGGSLAGRIRFVLEVAREVRAVWPAEHVLAARLSFTDWVEGGVTPEDALALVAGLEAEGVDLIDCSAGGSVATAQIPLAPGYQVPFAEAVKRTSTRAAAAVGLITEPAQADAIVREGRADLVLIGRESLRDPNFPLRAARALGQPVPVPPTYARAY